MFAGFVVASFPVVLFIKFVHWVGQQKVNGALMSHISHIALFHFVCVKKCILDIVLLKPKNVHPIAKTIKLRYGIHLN